MSERYLSGPCELLTVQELADYLRLAPSTLYSWRTERDGRGRCGPPSFRIGGRVVYRRSAVDAWLAAQEAAAAAAAAAAADGAA